MNPKKSIHQTPRINRKEIPPVVGGQKGYQRFKPYLRKDFGRRCAYCMIHEEQAGGSEHFEIDHHHPLHKGGARNDYANTYWSCRGCNHFKGETWPTAWESAQDFRFADPCAERDYGWHFVEDQTGELIWRTPCGEYHLLYLKLNRPSRKKRRKRRNRELQLLSEIESILQEKRNDLTTDPVLLQTLMKTVREKKREMALNIPLIAPIRLRHPIPEQGSLFP